MSEKLKQLVELIEKIQSVNKEASEIWHQLDAVKVFELFESFKKLCPDCNSLKEALEFYVYLPNDLKETADKLRRLDQLYMSGYLNIDIDMIYKSVISGNDNCIKPSEPKPFKDFWSILFILTMLKNIS